MVELGPNAPDYPFCPTCKTWFESGIRYCRNDGTKLTIYWRPVASCVVCGRKYEMETNFCTVDGGVVLPEVFPR